MKCPRDRSILVFTDEGTHARNRCRQCQGFLVSKEEVLAVIGGKAPEAAKLQALPESGVACPRDGSSMRRVEHQGVEADLCLECYSVWLDAGELDKVVAQGRKAKRAGAGAAAALAGAAAVAAAAQPAQAQSLASSIAQGAGEIVAEGAIELALELVGEAIGSVLGSLF
jgi:Zn-finger nucleic acid-binding protein